MSTLAEIRRKHNANKLITTEGVKTYGQLTSEKIKEETAYLNSLYKEFKESPLSLSLEEIVLLREREHKKSDISLSFDAKIGGFVMITSEQPKKQVLRSLSTESKSALFEMSTYMNKDGILKYDDENLKPIESYESLRLILSISDRQWRKISKELQGMDILKKIQNKVGGHYIILNPFFISKSYTINELKFLHFSEFFKKSFDDLDYYYLCKKFEINPA